MIVVDSSVWIGNLRGTGSEAVHKLNVYAETEADYTSTAGYYAWRSRPDSKRAVEDRALLDDIRQAHADSGGRHGSPRVHAALRAYGRQVGRGRIERLMRRHGVRGLVAQRRRVQTTDSRHALPVVPNLLDRKFSETSRPNQVWLADLTYIPTGEGCSIWLPSWTCTRARSLAGACATISGPSWRPQHC